MSKPFQTPNPMIDQHQRGEAMRRNALRFWKHAARGLALAVILMGLEGGCTVTSTPTDSGTAQDPDGGSPPVSGGDAGIAGDGGLGSGPPCSEEDLQLLVLIINDVVEEIWGPEGLEDQYIVTLPLESGATSNPSPFTPNDELLRPMLESLDQSLVPYCDPSAEELESATGGMIDALDRYELPETESARQDYLEEHGNRLRILLKGPLVVEDDAVVRWSIGRTFELFQGASSHYRRVDGLWVFQGFHAPWVF